ncbi:hypothetical protein P7C73_g1248, partial [Tremellales sp. Uapishka_1]
MLSRSLYTTPTFARNVLSRYARRSPLPPPTFETSSTAPAGSSLQEIPAPADRQDSTKQAVQVPAMIPLHDSSASSPLAPAERRDTLIVQGVSIPPKPRPPKEEECCMSGCINCVYTVYSEEMEEYNASIKLAQEALLSVGKKRTLWPEELRDANNLEEKEVRVDATMDAFLALENRLKKKQVVGSSAAS